jgi:hypothetical protein
VSAAEANRRRVAAARCIPEPKGERLPPGLTGAEILALRRLVPSGSAASARTEYAGGWQSTRFKVGGGR